MRIGKYLNLEEFCTCTNTYKKYLDKITPYPQNRDSIKAIEDLAKYIIDPIIDVFGRDKFKLTYGFCSATLKTYLNKKDPITNLKNGRVDPTRDQHMAYEVKHNGKYYCDRLGAACDFLILDLPSDRLIDWILQQKLPFDSLYFYGIDRPIHISYGRQHKRDIWTFNQTGQPTKKGIEAWVSLARNRE
jgi:hypothetical protein